MPLKYITGNVLNMLKMDRSSFDEQRLYFWFDKDRNNEAISPRKSLTKMLPFSLYCSSFCLSVCLSVCQGAVGRTVGAGMRIGICILIVNISMLFIVAFR